MIKLTKSGLMYFNRGFEDDLTELDIYPKNNKIIYYERYKIIKYLSIRNQYRQNKLNDLWSLFQKEIHNNSLNILI